MTSEEFIEAVITAYEDYYELDEFPVNLSVIQLMQKRYDEIRFYIGEEGKSEISFLYESIKGDISFVKTSPIIAGETTGILSVTFNNLNTAPDPEHQEYEEQLFARRSYIDYEYIVGLIRAYLEEYFEMKNGIGKEIIHYICIRMMKIDSYGYLGDKEFNIEIYKDYRSQGFDFYIRYMHIRGIRKTEIINSKKTNPLLLKEYSEIRKREAWKLGDS